MDSLRTAKSQRQTVIDFMKTLLAEATALDDPTASTASTVSTASTASPVSYTSQESPSQIHSSPGDDFKQIKFGRPLLATLFALEPTSPLNLDADHQPDNKVLNNAVKMNLLTA